MRDIKVLKVYNLVDSDGNRLRLRLGILKSRTGEVCISNKDIGYRWSFIGEHIPMPVRSMTWFNGFPEETMLEWLKRNGWYPKTCVWMSDGTAKVYELPRTEEPSKGNEVPYYIYENGKIAVNDAIKMFRENGRMLKAVQLYRYVINPCCSLAGAKRAVDAMCIDNQQ